MSRNLFNYSLFCESYDIYEFNDNGINSESMNSNTQFTEITTGTWESLN